MSTMQALSSSTMIPPVPIMIVSPARSSVSMARSSMEGGMQPREAPPAWSALSGRSPIIPPPMS